MFTVSLPIFEFGPQGIQNGLGFGQGQFFLQECPLVFGRREEWFPRHGIYFRSAIDVAESSSNFFVPDRPFEPFTFFGRERVFVDFEHLFESTATEFQVIGWRRAASPAEHARGVAVQGALEVAISSANVAH